MAHQAIKCAKTHFFSPALMPLLQCRTMHINAIGQQGESLWFEFQFALPGFRCVWPEGRALFQPFGHQTQHRAVKVKDVAEPAASRQVRPTGSLRLAVSARSGGLRLKRVHRRLVKTKAHHCARPPWVVHTLPRASLQSLCACPSPPGRRTLSSCR